MGKTAAQIALELIKSGQKLSKHDLSYAAGCNDRSAARALKQLHEKKLIVIVSWGKCYYLPIPIYGIGTRDKTRPRPMTPAERTRKRRKNVEVRWQEMMQKRSRRLREKHESKRSSTAGA